MTDNKFETVDDILASFENMAKSHEIMDAETYIRGAERLQALMQGEQDKLYILEQEVAKRRISLLESGKTAAWAKIAIESIDIYREARSQRAKVERCITTIQLAKAHARLANDIRFSQK